MGNVNKVQYESFQVRFNSGNLHTKEAYISVREQILHFTHNLYILLTKNILLILRQIYFQLGTVKICF